MASFSSAFGAVSYRPAPEGIPGVVLVTADADGEPRFDCVGEAAPGRRMEPDTVFWMASNTKGVAAALVLSLASEGILSLDGRVLIAAPLMEKWAAKQTPPCVKVGYSFGMKVDGKGSLFHGGVGGTWAEVNVKTRRLRLYMANFEGKSKAASEFKKTWMKSSKLTP